MFIDVVRRHIATLPAENAGWLAGLRDPLVGKALTLIHDKPAHDWTHRVAGETGRLVAFGAGRTFHRGGRNAADALSRQMAHADCSAELLTSGNANVASIAADIGYDSEAAFSRAFKKMIGVPPSAWRRQRA